MEQGYAAWTVRGILQSILPRTDLESYLIWIGDEDHAGFQPRETMWLRKYIGELLYCKAGPDERYCFRMLN
jgi:hypothetical protein